MIDENVKCTGCSACANICPKDAVSITLINGFYRAKVNSSKCIKCGLCNSVCILDNVPTSMKKTPIKVYGGKTKNKSVWLSSSSGGAFTEICKAFGDSDTFVFGVSLDEHFNATFQWVKGVSNISIFSGSKYIQSYVNKAFIYCKELLNENKKIVFCGTPCQIYGLKKFLSKEYDNLLCIDLICHGVSSPTLFHDHISFLENKYKKKITDYKFREKKKFFGKYIDYVPTIYFEGGKSKRIFNDYFVASFLSGISINDSCTSCFFKSNERVGDITIGDLKKAWDLLPIKKNIENYSLISFNTSKGLGLFEKMKNTMNLFELDIAKVNKFNHSFYQIEKEDDKRCCFLEDYFENYGSKNNLKALYKKYLKKHKTNIIPYFVPNWLKRIMKR